MLQNNIKAKEQELENNQDDYNESADEDYDPSASKIKTRDIENGDNDDDDDDDDEGDNDEFELDQSDKREMKKYDSIVSDSGGLVKTRSQRIHEKNENKEKRPLQKTNNNTSSLNIDSIWAELNGKTSANIPDENVSITGNNQKLEKVKENKVEQISTVNSLDRIKIKRTFEFAGEMITEEKWVDVNSEEAKAHLNSTKIENVQDKAEYKKSEKKGPLRRKRKRESLLDAVISNSSNTKLSTLEKSRLDWATYVDKNSISDELKYKNKSGFLEKQDFLDRVGNRQDSLYKDAKLKSSKQ